MKQKKRNIYIAGLLLSIFIFAQITVSVHNANESFHKHCHHTNDAHHEDECAICFFAVTPFTSSLPLTFAAPFVSTITGNIVPEILATPSQTVQSFFLRGPPCFYSFFF